MSQKTPVWIICAPFPRSGATTFTRLLVDHYLFTGRGVTLFETDLRNKSLEMRYPHLAQTVDLATTPGQIVLFDQLIQDGAMPRVVEISPQAHPLFVSQARNNGFFEEATKHGLDPAILFISNGTRKALDAGLMIQALWRRVPVFPVINEGLVRLGTKLNDHLDAFPSRRSFQVPQMEPLLREIVEDPRFSFAEFMRDPPTANNMSLVLRADLREWTMRVFAQLRSHELRRAFELSEFILK